MNFEQERKHLRLVKQVQPRRPSLLFHKLKLLVPLSEVHLAPTAPDRCAHERLHQERLNIMRASAESLHGHQVNWKLSLPPITCCRDEEQCFWSAALSSRRGVPLARRSLVHNSRRCSSTVSPCRLVLIGASVKDRPLTCSERLEYVCIVPPTPLDFKTVEHSHHQTRVLISSSAASVRPGDCREVVSTHQNRAPLRFWAVPY